MLTVAFPCGPPLKLLRNDLLLDFCGFPTRADGEFLKTLQVASTLVLEVIGGFAAGVLSWGEEQQRGVPFDTKVRAKRFAKCGGAINFGHIHVVLVVFGELVPNRSQFFAMTAPRSEKFDEPGFVADDLTGLLVDDSPVKVFIVEVDGAEVVVCGDQRSLGNHQTDGGECEDLLHLVSFS